MADPSVEPGPREDRAGRAARGRVAGAGLVSGMALLLSVAFALGGAAQVGLAVYFLLDGHPAVVVPLEQPDEALSVSIGGWLPLGACGAVMLVLAWVMRGIRRSLRGEEAALNSPASRRLR